MCTQQNVSALIRLLVLNHVVFSQAACVSFNTQAPKILLVFLAIVYYYLLFIV
uniref:Uncharacterized protein n=1 Tax=Anguilla anguilla TaxID=7936 RepID=A0A0E9SWV7_ANGAN